MEKRIQISAGGVVYKVLENGSVQIALTFRNDKKLWCLPKGKLNEGENDAQAAEREVVEETGLLGFLGERIDAIHYSFKLEEENIEFDKTVTFFLYKHQGKVIARDDKQVQRVGWFFVAEALKKMKYPSEREIVEKAKSIIEDKIG